MTRAELTAWVSSELASSHEARWLVDDVMGAQRSPSDAVSDRQRFLAEALVDRRLAGVPLQYVLGHWSFRSLELAVDPRVLIPRPETEQVVQLALDEIARRSPDAPLRVCDLGTGSGAIALAIAVETAQRPGPLAMWATDLDYDALAVAQANRATVDQRHPGIGSTVSFALGSWFHALPHELRGALDLVVANPPYVSEAEWDDLAAEVRFEPYGALVAPGGSDGTPGLGDVEAVLVGACEWLADAGVVLVEMAPHQTSAAAELATRLGFADIAVHQDLAGRDRALIARRRATTSTGPT